MPPDQIEALSVLQLFIDADGAIVIPNELTRIVLEEWERIKGLDYQARHDFPRCDDLVEVFQRNQRF